MSQVLHPDAQMTMTAVPKDAEHCIGIIVTQNMVNIVPQKKTLPQPFVFDKEGCNMMET